MNNRKLTQDSFEGSINLVLKEELKLGNITQWSTHSWRKGLSGVTLITWVPKQLRPVIS